MLYPVMLNGQLCLPVALAFLRRFFMPLLQQENCIIIAGGNAHNHSVSDAENSQSLRL
jgi:hypothetical protein